VTRLWLAVAGLGGLAAILAGTAAAHIAAAPHQAELLRTGALYGMVHATVLVAMIALAQGREPRRGLAAFAGWAFAVGILLFSFSLYALALGGPAWLGMVTPFGGISLCIGWAALLLLASRRR
jgi:uncharacterized membrane protein YgdD (TMEM256/DUF423 family)